MLGYLEQNFVLFLWGLHLLLNLLFSLVELLEINTVLGKMSIQVLIVIRGVKCIALLTGTRLEPVLGISYILAYNTVAMGDVMSIGIMFIIISRVGFVLIASNPKD